LKYILLLDDFLNADRENTKVRARKIIFQKLRKEVMGQNWDKRGWEDMALAHSNLVKSFAQKTVLYTGSPAVEDVKVVDTRTEFCDPKALSEYRSRAMTALGIGYLQNDSSMTVSAANLSVSQLMLVINSISEQLEVVFEDWYRLVLDEQGFGAEYCPSLEIIDSELLSPEVRHELAKSLYNTFSASRETAFTLMGLKLDDETARRKKENKEGLDEVYLPYATSYTRSGGEAGPGRPANTDSPGDKQLYDKDYNDNVRV